MSTSPFAAVMSNLERVPGGPQEAECRLIVVQQHSLQVIQLPSAGLFEKAQQQQPAESEVLVGVLDYDCEFGAIRTICVKSADGDDRAFRSVLTLRGDGDVPDLVDSCEPHGFLAFQR